MTQKRIFKFKKIYGLIIIITISILIKCLIIVNFIIPKKDYEKLGIKIRSNNIEEEKIYDKSENYCYKIYDLKFNSNNEINEIKNKLCTSKYWSKNKFYEYAMKEFYEMDDKNIINSESNFFYNKGCRYAILNLNNKKLYYLEKDYLVNN